jgi:hypothetical protein
MMHYTRWIMILAIVCTSAFPLLGTGGALAATPHENPDTLAPVFSGIALFQYYSYSLDAILLKDAPETEARLSKLPWANVPERLTTTTGDFAASGIGLIRLVIQMDQDLVLMRTLGAQSRLDEAAIVAVAISSNLTAARGDLTRIERAVTVSGREFGVVAAPGSGDLQASYQEVHDRISRIREMLSVFRQLLVSEVETIGPDQALLSELAKQGIEIDASNLPLDIPAERTEITLFVDPLTAFVGDNISFQGDLASSHGPLAERDVDILLNSSTYVTVRADSVGNYRGTLEIPYWYQPEITVQALYYPRAGDQGRYLASLSPAVRLQVQYYKAKLELEPEAKAYPGRATSLDVRFDYAEAPVPAARDVEVYLDGLLVADTTVTSAESTLRIDLAPDATEGKHNLTVSAAAQGQYAPSLASAQLLVTRIVPQLDIGLPRFILIPGTLSVTGRVYSEFGPLVGTPIIVRFGDAETRLVSQPGGALSAKIGNRGMNLGILGSQDLTVQVEPAEPWFAPLTTTRPILVVNAPNGSAVIIVIVVLGIYLPRRLRKRFGMPVPTKGLPLTERPLQPSPAVHTVASTPLRSGSDDGPESQVAYWYRQAADLVARIAGTALKPQQTLREFALATRRALGPAVIHFMTLTRLLEMVLYSRYRPTARDVEDSRKLALTVKDLVKG